MKKSNQQGFAPVVFVVAALVVLVGAGMAAYFGFLGNKPKELLTNVVPGMSTLPVLKESDFSNINDPLIRKHFAEQYSKPTFRVTSTSDGMGQNSKSTVEVQYISEKDFRMRMVQLMEGKETQDIITIGDTTYIKDYEDNSWWKQVNRSEDTKEIGTIDPKDFSREEIIREIMDKTTVTYVKLGEEACASRTCYKYEEKNSGTDSGTRIFWFDTKELLLRKEQNSYGEYASESEYSYDNIQISAPSPTKDVPEGKNIYEMMINKAVDSNGIGKEYEADDQSIPSQEEIENAKKILESMGNGKVDISVDESAGGSGE